MRTRSLLAACAAVALAACGGGDGGGGGTPVTPVSGDLVLRVRTPNADDRAMLIRISGPAQIDGIQPTSGLAVRFQSNANGAVAAVFGSLPNGPVLRFTVPDVNKVSEYSAAISDVADTGNRVRPSLDGYSATIGSP